MSLRIRDGYVIEYIGYSFRTGDEESSPYLKVKDYLEKTYPQLYEDTEIIIKIESQEEKENITMDNLTNRMIKDKEEKVMKKSKKDK